MFEIVMMLIGAFTFSRYTYLWSWAYVSTRWELKNPRLVEIELAWMPLALMALLQVNWALLSIWAAIALLIYIWFIWKSR